MPAYRKLLKPAVWGFYIIIGLEFLFMISPFALYFYGSYGDVLNSLHRWPATAWLTGFFLPPDLPLESWDEIPAEHRGGHTTPRDFDRGLYKVLFTRARTHHPHSRGRDIVITAYGREPLLRVRVDLDRGEVTAVESPPASVVWGDIPTPLY